MTWRPTGTRTNQNEQTIHPPGGSINASLNRDPGMSKNVTASCTFGSGKISAANGTFAAFGLNDPLMVEGVALNNGFFTVTGLDATNQAFLTVDSPPKSEGPISATIRTP